MRNKRVNIKWKTLLTLFILGFILMGCNVQGNRVIAKEEGSGASLKYELVTPPYDADIQQMIDKNKKNAGYKTIQQGSDTLVMIFLGQRPSGGYKIVVDKVEKKSDQVTIFYSEKKPEGMAISVISYPSSVIKIPKTSLPIVVKKTN